MNEHTHHAAHDHAHTHDHEHDHDHAHGHAHGHAHDHPHAHDHHHEHAQRNDHDHAYWLEDSQEGANTIVANPSHVHYDEHAPLGAGVGALRIGVAGPVGAGKTATVAALTRALSQEMDLAVITNDIYTTEDADFLLKNGVVSKDRIIAVETGGCPHTAVRDDISANLEAVEALEAKFPKLELILIESGGDNLTATFSRGLVHQQIFVIDVAGGDKVPRKGGPGTATSDLLMINKTDLAPYVGADLSIMERDARAKRGSLPFIFTSLREETGVDQLIDWVRSKVAAHSHAASHAA